MFIELGDTSVYAANGGVEWTAGNRPLCLVHGASLDHSVWTIYSRYFARNGFNVLTPDLAGHARTGGNHPASIEDMADWLNQLLDRCAEEYPDYFSDKVALCGHSMGSLIALETAARRNEKFSHLLLLATAVPMRVGQPLLDACEANLQSSRDMVAIFGHAYQSRLGGNPIAGINVVNAALALMAQAGDGVMYRDMLSCHQYEGGLQAASAITAHTTLILGDEDRMTPVKAARALADALGRTRPTSSSIVLDGCGHMMLAEQPEETLQAMIAGLSLTD